MIGKIKRLILKFRVWRWNLIYADKNFKIDIEIYEKALQEIKERKNINKCSKIINKKEK